MIYILIVAAIFLAAYLFLNFYPPIGGRPSPETKQRMAQMPNYKKGKFENQILTVMDTSFKGTVSIMKDFIKGNPNSKPAEPIVPVRYVHETGHGQTRATWFGHSALLVQMEGKTLFFDPMLGRAPSPFPALGGKRYSKELPVEIEHLPQLDAVFFSHDHYDHLDYGTIKKLQERVARFFVPLGVKAHLVRWGVDSDKVQEFAWGDEADFDGIKFACTPARHFSGRGLTNRNSTLWCSWVLAGSESKLFFSGDSGYGPHFKKIGEQYGPFDMTFMECGQYDERWAAIHMTPEETVQAHVDVKGEVLVPIHWGAFTLSLHDWTDPVDRAVAAASARDVVILTPQIGETLLVGDTSQNKTWWRA